MACDPYNENSLKIAKKAINFNYPEEKFAEDEDKRINNELFFDRIGNLHEYRWPTIAYLDAKPGNSTKIYKNHYRYEPVFTANWNQDVVDYLKDKYRLSDERCKRGLFVQSILDHPGYFSGIYYDGETTMDGDKGIPSESGLNFLEQIFEKKVQIGSIIALTLSTSRKAEEERESLPTHKKYGYKLNVSNELSYYKTITKRIASKQGYRIRFLKGSRSYRNNKMKFLLIRIKEMI
jgi:hypothetical protein